jgi:hypothetical protein
MTFTRTGPNSARKDDVEVKIAKRDQLHYVQGGETMVVPIEIGTDRVIAIGISRIASSKRQEFRIRIGETLDFLGIPYRFDS